MKSTLVMHSLLTVCCVKHNDCQYAPSRVNCLVLSEKDGYHTPFFPSHSQPSHRSVFIHEAGWRPDEDVNTSQCYYSPSCSMGTLWLDSWPTECRSLSGGAFQIPHGCAHKKKKKKKKAYSTASVCAETQMYSKMCKSDTFHSEQECFYT